MASQSDYENALLEAIDYLIDKRVENLDRDKTITATIVKCENALTQEYEIYYNNGYLTAYAQADASYRENQTVYVLVPLGDFSQRKTIVGLASSIDGDNNITFVSSLLNDYNMIGKNVIEDRDGNTPIGLNSYLKNDYILLYDRDMPKESLVHINQDEFGSYIKKADALLIEGTFNTRLPREHRLSKTGIYGVQFVLAFKDKDKPDEIKHVSYVLDTNNMTGNPLLYTTYSNQYAIFPIDTENFLYIESILAYSKDFVIEDDRTQEILWGDDIFMKEFEIYGLQEIAATDGDYTLRLSMPQGGVFQSINSSDVLSVVGTTTYQINSDISDSTTYYWFAKDDRISSVSEEYQMYGGAGWRYLKEAGANKTFTTTGADNRAYENIYLVVAVYKESVVLKQEFTLYNEASRRDIEIQSDLGLKFSFDRGVPELTCLVNGKASDFENNHADDLFSFAWSKIDDYGNTMALTTSYEELEAQYQAGLASGIGYSELASIKNQMLAMEGVEFNRNVLRYPVKQIDARATFSCSVYLRENKDAKDYFIGSATITLYNEAAASPTDYYILIQNGDQVFQYSESGVSPASERYTDPLEIKPLDCHFYDPAGLEVNAETYSVKWVVPLESSMLVVPEEGMTTNPANKKEEWYTQRTFPLDIKESYDYQALSNQITCVVTYDGQEYQQDTDFLFVKVGDNGTNGTDVVGKISPKTDPRAGLLALELRTNQAARWNNGVPISQAPLQFELFKRNELLNFSGTSWTMAGGGTYSKCMSIGESTGIISWQQKTGSRYLTNLIVRASATFEGQSYYAFYPVPVINYKSVKSYTATIDKTKTLKNILYNADGRNPLYNKNQGVFFTLSNASKYIVYTAEGGVSDNSSTAAISLSFNRDADSTAKTLRHNYQDGEGVYIIPDDTYDGAYCNNRVRISIYANSSAVSGGNPEMEIIVPIHMSLNTYGLASLNAWDGNHIEINEDSNFILAPQIGAGVKDKDNGFTGIVMGKAQTYDQTQDDYDEYGPNVGLLGYAKGKQSIWLDAGTGKAVFGLPEQQASTNNNYIEGRIELVPGGESKIGEWNIGSRSLFNINKGMDSSGNPIGIDIDDKKVVAPYDRAYSGEYVVKGSTIGIPHDAQGIILNARPAYVSFKGLPLTSENSNIRFEDANTVIMPGDSLEVEIDPAKSSIFSIYRHTPYSGTQKGDWHRYPLVGINANGQFYTNAIEDGESTMGIGKIGAFGLSAAAGLYVGAQFAYGGSNILKFFIKDAESAGSINSRDIYLTTGTTLQNEYPRPFNIYGKTVNLYASNTSSTSETSTDKLSVTSGTIQLGHYGTNKNYLNLLSGNSSSSASELHTDTNLSITTNNGRTATIDVGKFNINTYSPMTLKINTSPSANTNAAGLTATMKGTASLTGFSTLKLQSSNNQRIDIGSNSIVLGSTDTTNKTSLTLNSNGASNLTTNNHMTIQAKSAGSVNIYSNAAQVRIRAGQSDSNSARIALTSSNSDGNTRFDILSGYGSISSTYNNNIRQCVSISPGILTNWGYFSGTNQHFSEKDCSIFTVGSIYSHQELRARGDVYSNVGSVRAKQGNVYGNDFRFNQTQGSSGILGADRYSTSLISHLHTIYNLLQNLKDQLEKAKTDLSNSISGAQNNLQGQINTINGRINSINATINNLDSRYALKNHTHSNYVTTDTYNVHRHSISTSDVKDVLYGGGPNGVSLVAVNDTTNHTKAVLGISGSVFRTTISKINSDTTGFPS